MEGRTSLHKDFLLDGMLVHRRVTSDSKFAGTHFHTWVDSGTIVKFPVQEHNAVPLAKVRIQTARSGARRPNH